MSLSTLTTLLFFFCFSLLSNFFVSSYFNFSVRWLATASKIYRLLSCFLVRKKNFPQISYFFSYSCSVYLYIQAIPNNKDCVCKLLLFHFWPFPEQVFFYYCTLLDIFSHRWTNPNFFLYSIKFKMCENFIFIHNLFTRMCVQRSVKIHKYIPIAKFFYRNILRLKNMKEYLWLYVLFKTMAIIKC